MGTNWKTNENNVALALKMERWGRFKEPDIYLEVIGDRLEIRRKQQ